MSRRSSATIATPYPLREVRCQDPHDGTKKQHAHETSSCAEQLPNIPEISSRHAEDELCELVDLVMILLALDHVAVWTCRPAGPPVSMRARIPPGAGGRRGRRLSRACQDLGVAGFFFVCAVEVVVWGLVVSVAVGAAAAAVCGLVLKLMGGDELQHRD